MICRNCKRDMLDTRLGGDLPVVRGEEKKGQEQWGWVCNCGGACNDWHIAFMFDWMGDNQVCSRDEMDSAMKLNTGHQGTTHLVRRTLDGFVGSPNQEES